MTDSVLLTGIDGSNPLGFLAALGTLKILHDRHMAGAMDVLPRLSWENDGCWRPRLWGVEDIDAVFDVVLQDRETWKSEPALDLAYDENGQLVRNVEENVDQLPPQAKSNDEFHYPELFEVEDNHEKDKGKKDKQSKLVRDLKPRPEAFREFLLDLVETRHATYERSLAVAAAYGSEMAVDNNGNVKPTAFHFTAGQQMFLSMVRDLCRGIRRADIEEALLGPWKNVSKLPSLSWDAASPRIYALRASDPSQEKRGSVAGANWLAFVALQFFPVVPIDSQVLTPCVEGQWKDSRFRWPLWRQPLSADSVASLLRMGFFKKNNRMPWEEVGIEVVLESAISRSDQGGYGQFSPAAVIN